MLRVRQFHIHHPRPRVGPVEFDPVSVVSIGRSIAWATSEAVVSLQDHVLAALTFTVDEFDGRRTVRSLDGCSPYVDLLTCPSCERTLLAVVSYGEVQPARWRLVVDGLIGGQDA